MEMFKSKWGNWKDISTGSLCSYKYVLQARRHKNGKIQMRAEKIQAYDTVAHPTIDQLKEISYRDNPRIDKNLLLEFFKAGNECACMEHENIEDYFNKHIESKMGCPGCGESENIHFNMDYSKFGVKNVSEYLCNECGTWFTSKLESNG